MMIRLQYITFDGNANSLGAAAERLSGVEAQKPEASGNSAPLKGYIQCLQEMQSVMEAYCTLLKADSERIRSAGKAMQEAEQKLLQTGR